MGNSQAGTNSYALVATNGGNNGGGHPDAFPVSGTLSNLRVYTDVPPGGTTVKKVAVSQNGSDSALNCTLTGTDQTCTDTTDTLSVSAGDYFVMHMTNQSGTPKTGDYSWSVDFTPTNANDTVLLGSTVNNGNNTRTWLPFSGFTATAEANLVQAIPEAGTIDAFTLNYSSFVSGSVEWNIWLNSASSTLDCTGTGGSTSCVDSTHSESVSQGDTISVSQVPFSPGSGVKPGFGARYVPATAGDFPVLAGSTGSTDAVAGGTAYISFSGGQVRNINEATTTQVVGTAFTVSSMTVVRGAAPGSGKTITYTLRVNSADSSLSCSLSGTGSGAGITTNTCTGSVSLSPGDLVDWSTTLTSGGVGAHVAIGAIANVASGAAPTVTTDNATAIGATSAVLNATIDDNGGDDATEHGFAYSTDSTLSTSVSTTTDGSFTGTGYFNDIINSLSNNTRYYFRAYATNGTGTGYGGIMNLFTGDSIPRRGIILFSGYKIKLVGGKIILHQQ